MGLPKLSRDYRDILALFAKSRVRYLVVGAYAVNLYTEPRYTRDIDLWVDRSPRNAERVYRALVEFGAPLKGESPALFEDKGNIYQLGAEPVRIDVIVSIAGVTFQTAWKRRKTVMVEGLRVNFIGKADLIKAKRASGRGKDLDDLAGLEGRS